MINQLSQILLILFFFISIIEINAHELNSNDVCEIRLSDVALSDPEYVNRMMQLIDPHCRTASYGVLESLENEFNKNYDDENQKTSKLVINGKVFTDSKNKMKIFEEILGLFPPKKLSELNNQKCGKVLCALEFLLVSKEAALRLMNIGKRTGYILTLDQSKNFIKQNGKNKRYEQLWSLDEIRKIDRITKRMPKSLLKLKNLKKLYRIDDRLKHNTIERTAALANPGSRRGTKINPGSIFFYGLAFKNPLDFERIFIHEVAHMHDTLPLFQGSEKNQHQSSGFSDISKWKEKIVTKYKKNGQPYRTWEFSKNKNANFLREYSSVNPYEDYADGIAFFLENPEILRTFAPQKFKVIKEKILKVDPFKRLNVNSFNLNENEVLDTINLCTRKMIRDFKNKFPLNMLNYFNNNKCLNTATNDLSRHLKNDDFKSFCQKGGKYELMKFLKYKVNKELVKVSYFLSLIKKNDFIVNECSNSWEPNFSNCLIRQLVEMKLIKPSESNLNENQLSILDQLSR